MLKVVKGARVCIDCETGELFIDLGNGCCKPFHEGVSWYDLSNKPFDVWADVLAIDYTNTGTKLRLDSTNGYYYSSWSSSPHYLLSRPNVRVDLAGQEYTGKLIKSSYTDASTGDKRYRYAFGNSVVIGGENTGEPFCVVVENNGHSVVVRFYVIDYTVDTTVLFGAWIDCMSIILLPEQVLPKISYVNKVSSTPTASDFNKLVNSLINAGYMAEQSDKL